MQEALQPARSVINAERSFVHEMNHVANPGARHTLAGEFMAESAGLGHVNELRTGSSAISPSQWAEMINQANRYPRYANYPLLPGGGE